MTITSTSAKELRFRLCGGLFEPGDPGFAEACTLFDAMIGRRPRFVARCTAPDDVIAALAFAREEGLEVAVGAGGLLASGSSLCDDGLLLDLRGMCDVDVDAERCMARVGGGAAWAQVDRATEAHGLATTGDNLLAAEVVTWDGRIVRASADENQELLWALRGGGGSFGVVTLLELALHPLGHFRNHQGDGPAHRGGS
ncbi:MAG TPA: FAD-binding protein [Thermoleophilaceae bacterium]|nr:FAD-binding protein [Thermoleophilaceae bacterium]